MRFSNAEANEFYEYICEFCHSCKKIYIYGGGNYGKRCLSFLQKKKVQIWGFITTEGGGDVLGIPVYKAEEILKELDLDSGIILAVKQEYQKQILEQFSFSCNVMKISAAEVMYMQTFVHLGELLDQARYPFRKKLDSIEWKNILVVQLESTFGDMIWSTAFYRELKSAFAGAYIVAIINSKFVSLYYNCPYIDKIVSYECDTILQEVSTEMEKKVNSFIKRTFAAPKFDAVFLPRLLPTSYADNWENILLAFASGAENRIAHAMYVNQYQRYMCDIISELFTVVAKHTIAKHEVLHDLDMLTVCGCGYVHDDMELWIGDKDMEFSTSILKDISEDVLLIAVALVGSSGTRSWSPCKYGNVFFELSRRYGNKIRFLLCGGTDANKASLKIPDEQKENCIDITGKTTLTEAAAVISRCALYLGSDTGLMHMAASFGIPIIEISASNMETPDYWGSSPRRTGPWKVDSMVLRPKKGLDECKYFCARPYAHCIDQVTEEQVVNALEDMICARSKQLYYKNSK